MRGRAVLLAVASALAIAPAAHAQAGVAFFGGTAWSARTDLTITQAGAPELAFSARWETRPFRDSPYYAARLSVLGARGGWELQLTHHKLYLANPPAEVADFQITHGFNLLTVQRSLRVRAFDVRGGLGAVIAHAESRCGAAAPPDITRRDRRSCSARRGACASPAGSSRRLGSSRARHVSTSP